MKRLCMYTVSRVWLALGKICGVEDPSTDLCEDGFVKGRSRFGIWMQRKEKDALACDILQHSSVRSISTF